MSNPNTLTVEVEDRIATITLNRPARMNAFTAEMSKELVEAFERTDADDEVRAVIVTGAGRAFCAGMDLEAGAATFDYAAGGAAGGGQVAGMDGSDPSVRDIGGLTTLRIFESLKPVIGAINGAAVGIGVTMTLPMDIRIATHDAKLGFVFARRGIVPEAASAWFLPRIVGISRAMEWCATGRVFSAEEGLQGGLIRSLHAPDALMAAARTLAHEIADNAAPVSVACTRQMMWCGLGLSHPMQSHRIDSRLVFQRGRSADAAEGVTSFLEKRPARFSDRVSTDMPDIYPWWDDPAWG